MPGTLITTVDSITKIGDDHRGEVIIAASHGGDYCGYCAARGGVAAVIFNDAGVGKAGAGIASLAYLDGLGIAAAAADYRSCRIGDGAHMRDHGTISFVNRTAAAAGCAPGQRVQECASLMTRVRATLPSVPERQETRKVVNDGPPRVIVMDSAALISDADKGCVVVTASHGGVMASAPTRAIGPDVAGAVFSDAGVGKDNAGISRLPGLDLRGIPGATVSADSATIGDGRSIWEEGVLSYVNEAARKCGITTGMTVQQFARRIADSQTHQTTSETQ